MKQVITKYERNARKRILECIRWEKIEYRNRCGMEGICGQCDDVLNEVVM